MVDGLISTGLMILEGRNILNRGIIDGWESKRFERDSIVIKPLLFFV